MKSFFTVMVLILFLIVSVSPSKAYKLESNENGQFLHWPSSVFPVAYRITANPPINADAFIGAIQRSFNAWQGVGNATISFQYAGTTGAKEPAYDGKNNVIMGTKITGNDVVGQSYIYYSVNSGEILDVDIVLNSSYAWATDGSRGKMDVQNTATHEIGHLCGLDDLYANEDSEKTMYGYIDYGETKKRTLDPDDMAGLAALYPHGSSSDDSGGGGSGCGAISPTNPPGPGDINFTWLFLILFLLWGYRLFTRRGQESSSP